MFIYNLLLKLPLLNCSIPHNLNLYWKFIHGERGHFLEISLIYKENFFEKKY